MHASARRPLLPLLLASVLALSAMALFWYQQGRAVPLPDLARAGKLQCASYSPFDKDQSPFDQPLRLRPERIDADLALLAERFSCVRTDSM